MPVLGQEGAVGRKASLLVMVVRAVQRPVLVGILYHHRLQLASTDMVHLLRSTDRFLHNRPHNSILLLGQPLHLLLFSLMLLLCNRLHTLDLCLCLVW